MDPPYLDDAGGTIDHGGVTTPGEAKAARPTRPLEELSRARVERHEVVADELAVGLYGPGEARSFFRRKPRGRVLVDGVGNGDASSIRHLMGDTNRLTNCRVEAECALGDRPWFRLRVQNGAKKATTALCRRETPKAQRNNCSGHDVILPKSARRQSNLGT